MEAGVCSNTTEECDDKLLCHDSSTHHTTPLQHHYCSCTKNGVYEDIGRTDEETRSVVTSVQNRPAAALIPCTCYDGQPGVFCGGECKDSRSWCRSGAWAQTCNVGGSLYQSDDFLLCQDNLFWRDQDSNSYHPISSTSSKSNGTVEVYGSRCQGSVKASVFPWYYYHKKASPV